MNFLHVRFLAPERLPLALSGILIAVVVAFWLSRSAGDAPGHPLSRWLPGLRMLAIAALMISILKPVVVQTESNSLQGELIVLLDRSHSMSVTDPERSPARCVAIADAAGMIAEHARIIKSPADMLAAREMRQLLDPMRTARSEVEYAQLTGHGIAAATQRLAEAADVLKTAASALQKRTATQPEASHLDATCTQIIQLLNSSESQSMSNNTYQQLRRLLDTATVAAEEPQAIADEHLYRSDPAIHAIADSVLTTPRIELCHRVLDHLQHQLPAEVHLSVREASPKLPLLSLGDKNAFVAVGETSDLSDALQAARKISDSKVLAVALFSDGRQVGGAARQFSLDVPFLSVNPAATILQDVTITSIDTPSILRLHDLQTVTVTIQGFGIHEFPIEVSLDEGGTIMTQQAIVSEGKTTMQFAKQFNVAGRRELKVHLVAALPDFRPASRTASRIVQVVDRKINVLPSTSTSDDETATVEKTLQSTLWIEDLSGGRATTLPTTQGSTRVAFNSNSLDSDVLILIDPEPGMLSVEEQQAVNLRVRQGCGLIIVVGSKFDPVAMAGTLLGPLLPWRAEVAPIWKTAAPDAAGYSVVPGESSPITRLTDNANENRRRWEQLPSIHTLLSIQNLKNGVTPILVESDSANAVLTENRFGAGRVLFLATPDTERWQGKLLDADADAFLHALVREAAGPPYGIESSQAALGLEAATITAGRQAAIRVRSIAAQDPVLDLLQYGRRINTIRLRPTANDRTTQHFYGTTPALPEGDYAVRLRSENPSDALMQSFHVEPNFEPETADLNPDEANLRRIARASGGDYLPLENANSILEPIQEMREKSPVTSLFELWDSAPLYCFVVGCLALEWTARKAVGTV